MMRSPHDPFVFFSSAPGSVSVGPTDVTGYPRLALWSTAAAFPDADGDVGRHDVLPAVVPGVRLLC